MKIINHFILVADNINVLDKGGNCFLYFGQFLHKYDMEINVFKN